MNQANLPPLEGGAFREPLLQFDHFDENQTGTYPYDGLVRRLLGPYDKSYRRFSEISCGLLAPKPDAGLARQIVNNLSVGSPAGFTGGMRRYFGVDLKIDAEEISATDSTDDMVSSAERLLSRSTKQLDLVFALVPRTSQWNLSTPYYRVKATLARKGIPSQMITRSTDPNNGFHLFNLAVAAYAKNGGTPWALHDGLENVDCLLGMSFTERVSELERIGERPRYVGFVNIFDSKGIWLAMLGTAEEYDWERLPSRVAFLLEEAIKFYENKKGAKPRRVLIHSSKRFGWREVKAVRDGLERIFKDDCDYALVHISDDVPLRFFDLSDPNRTPRRGLFAVLNNDTTFLCTTGKSEMGARIGTPVNLRVYVREKPQESVFDVFSISKHVFSLTKLDYGTLSAILRNPVSITYSNELAYMTAALQHTEWEELVKEPIAAKMKEVLWFL